MDVPPTSTAADPKRPAETTTQPDIAHVDGTKVDASLVPPQTGTDKGAVLGPSRNSFLDANPPICTPPPLFTEFAGVGEVSAGEGPTNKEPVMQDEQPTELTEEQKAAEAKRQAFLMKYLTELEDIRERLQGELEATKDKTTKKNTVKSKLEDTEKSLSGVKTRMSKKAFSEPPANPSIPEISLAGKHEDIQSTLQRGILDALLARDDAGPLIVRVDIPKGKTKQKAKDAVTTFAEQNQFSWQSESPNINIAF
ncbi:hypothetical protein BS17DRAFT_453407 [Gyrodon lividus]|nr:hypothetical protein BS17DRAFT_453407 [Gyrodon lividus]